MFGFFKKDDSVGISGKFISGLPLTENHFVRIKILEDHFQLIATQKGDPERKEFSLPIEKISSVKILNAEEVKKVIEQSAPGMILGAAAFGVIGAMIGGRIQTKEKSTLKQILKIDYVSDGNKQIVLDCSFETFFTQRDFLKRCREIIPERNAPNAPIQL